MALAAFNIVIAFLLLATGGPESVRLGLRWSDDTGG